VDQLWIKIAGALVLAALIAYFAIPRAFDARRAHCLNDIDFASHGHDHWSIADGEGGEVTRYANARSARAAIAKKATIENSTIRYGSFVYRAEEAGDDQVKGCLKPESERAPQLSVADVATYQAELDRKTQAVADDLASCLNVASAGDESECIEEPGGPDLIVLCGPSISEPLNCTIRATSLGEELSSEESIGRSSGGPWAKLL
jgi:hypothetical protein